VAAAIVELRPQLWNLMFGGEGTSRSCVVVKKSGVVDRWQGQTRKEYLKIRSWSGVGEWEDRVVSRSVPAVIGRSVAPQSPTAQSCNTELERTNPNCQRLTESTQPPARDPSMVTSRFVSGSYKAHTFASSAPAPHETPAAPPDMPFTGSDICKVCYPPPPPLRLSC